MLNGMKLPAGYGFATVVADMDFETYSEAGYCLEFVEKDGLWVWRLRDGVKSTSGGLGVVGAYAYSEHETTEVLSIAYDLKDGKGRRLWLPNMWPPRDLFEYIQNGGLIEAHNSLFEFYIWMNVCVRRYGWPPIQFWQLRDSMAKARAFGLPGALADVTKALELDEQKDASGKRLLKKFSGPRSQTKKDKRLRVLVDEEPLEATRLYGYNLQDIVSESAVSISCPDLSETELNLWLLDQLINIRGVSIDNHDLQNCISIVEQATVSYNQELRTITGGQVEAVTKIEPMRDFLIELGVPMPDMRKDTVESVLKDLDWEHYSPTAKRVLEIRQLIGSAGVKKLSAINRMKSSKNKLHDLFAYCGAERTGRWAGRGAQPQNLPKAGPRIQECDELHGCGKHYSPKLDRCPWCDTPDMAAGGAEWGFHAVEDALRVIATKDLKTVEHYYGNAVATVTGCLRSLFVADEGKELIAADYNSIEAIVLAQMAGEEWRLEVFRTHGKVYEMSASKITGVSFEDMMAHAGYTDLTLPNWWEAPRTGEHHPDRQKIGKVAELASGYQGWISAWKRFGAEKFLTHDEIKNGVSGWRAASPMIQRFWKECERAAINAIKHPGQVFEYRYVSYFVHDDVLHCVLPSGRHLHYHKPILNTVERFGRPATQITFMGFNSDYKKGPRGWMRLDTYGGSLVENIVQAAARDIMAHAMPIVESNGYEIVMHVHDELITQVPIGSGSIAQLEGMMVDLPEWAHDWPIRATGGWRGRRYRKD